jgi:hypothetical protein
MQLQRLISAEGFVFEVYVETANWNGVSQYLAAFSGLIGVQMGIELKSGGITRR